MATSKGMSTTPKGAMTGTATGKSAAAQFKGPPPAKRRTSAPPYKLPSTSKRVGK